MSQDRRIACVVNPVGKRAERAWQLVQQHCAALGFPAPTRYDTTIAEPGGAQAQEAIAAGANHIIGIGGDGTIRNISNVVAHSDVSLGIVPTGTANIFHLNAVGKTRKLDANVRTALLGEVHKVDLGRVTLGFDGDRPDWQGRFLVVVGIGRDAISINDVSPNLKRLIGSGAYFAAGATQLLQPNLPMQVEIDGQPLGQKSAWSVLVGNCGRVPGGISVLPTALVNDGLLNVMQIAPTSLASWLPVALRGLRGSARQLTSLHEATAREITVIPERPMTVQIDGDVWSDVTRIEIQVEPGALLVRSRSSRKDVDRPDRQPDQSTYAGMDGSER